MEDSISKLQSTELSADNQLLALLSAEAGNNKKESIPSSTPDSQDDLEEVLEDESQQEEVSEIESEEAEEDTEEPLDDTEIPLDTLVTIKINGKTEKIPLEELQNGYQRFADYTHKTQAVAEERKAVQSERNEVNQARSFYQQILPKLQQQLTQGYEQEPNWEQMIQDDPVAAFEGKLRWDKRKELIASTYIEQQRINAEIEKEQQAEYQRTVQEQSQLLVKMIPEWKDGQTYQKDYAEIANFVGSHSKAVVSGEELATYTDARSLYHLRNSMLYEKLKASAPKATEKQSPTLKPSAPVNQNSIYKQIDEAERMLKETGDSEFFYKIAKLQGELAKRKAK